LLEFLILFFLSAAVTRAAGPPNNVDWAVNVSPVNSSDVDGVATDASQNIYVDGTTSADLNQRGAPPGTFDAFLVKYDASGNRLWTQQTFAPDKDVGYSVSVDASGNPTLIANVSAFNNDKAIVFQYDSAGNLLASNSFSPGGTILSSSVDSAGNVLLAGYSPQSSPVFVDKYSSTGSLLWTHQFGAAAGDMANSVTTDMANNVYVASILESGPNPGPTVQKYDPAGNLVWTRQIAPGDLLGDATVVAVDKSKNVYVAGTTSQSLFAPNADTTVDWGDVFVAKYDPSGNLIWGRQFGTDGIDEPNRLAIDDTGNVALTGILDANSSGSNYFLYEFDSSGNLVSSRNDTDDSFGAVAFDNTENLLATGNSDGAAFGIRGPMLVKFAAVPEPANAILALLAAVSLFFVCPTWAPLADRGSALVQREHVGFSNP
jgi:hypothetical protein